MGDLPLAAQVMGIALVVAVLWRVFLPKPAIRIVFTPDGSVDCHGVAKARVREIREFFVQDVGANCKIVFSVSAASGYRKIQIKGKIDDGKKQRIRNFLHSVL